MLTLLALAAQAATISNATAAEAMKCGIAATVVAAESEPPLRVVAQYMYFVMQAAKADPAGKPYLHRVGELAGRPGEGDVPAPDAAKTLLAGCDRTYPLARTDVTPRLPAKAFDRDVMCMGILSMLRGVAEEMAQGGGDKGLGARIDAVLAQLGERVNDAALAEQGMASEEAFMAAMGDQLMASLALGNPAAVARACGVTGI